MKNILTTILIFIAIDLIGWILLWQYELYTGERVSSEVAGYTIGGFGLVACYVSAAYLANNWKSINK